MKRILISTAAIVGLCVAQVTAGPFTFNAYDSDGRSASASFEQAGQTLTLSLLNTATGDLVNGDNTFLLEALFFSLPGDPVLQLDTAVLSTGSRYIYPVATTPTSVVGLWEYGTGTGGPRGATMGISAVGFGMSWFPSSVDGGDYGLTTTDDDVATPLPPNYNGLFDPLIQSGVVFTFTLPAGYTLTSPEKVSFQYGTALNEPNITPDGGATVLLLGSALLGLGLIRNRFGRK